MDVLEETLLKIAKLFNGLNIKWNVGGSVLLARFGLHENPHDIDIVIAKEDIEKAKAALEGIGTQKHVPKSKIFVSEHYYKFDIGGVEADLIAGFKIRHDGGVYEYKPDFDGEKDGEGIAYASLEDWYTLYLLMPEGEGKAGKIEEYLTENKNIDKGKLNALLKRRLPMGTAHKICELKNKD